MINKLKIASVVGARPQFIKCKPVSQQVRLNHQEILIHTGQHYDFEMNKIFFEQLGIPEPDYNLNVGSATHGKQTASILERIERVLQKEVPNLVVVYGDTNSTIAGALAAAKLQIPVAHVESGLRSFNKLMPEEINRILTDHISSLLFAPTETAITNLRNENIKQEIHLTGDVMYDALLQNISIAKQSTVLHDYNLTANNYNLATIHRPINTDNKHNLKQILLAFGKVKDTIILPIHPRTKKFLKYHKLNKTIKENIIITKPFGYLDFLWLEKNAKKIITDSGGIQKEAYLLKKPCITLRKTTEWVETIKDGWNILVGSDSKQIMKAIKTFQPKHTQSDYYGKGNAAKKIKTIIDNYDKKII